MTMMTPTSMARAIAVVLPAGTLLLAFPAMAAAPSIPEAPASLFASGTTTSSSLALIDGLAPAHRIPGGTGPNIRLAGKLTSAVKGAAVGYRAARGSNKSEEQLAADNDQETEKDAEGQKSGPEAGALPGGPFKVVIPGQKENENANQNGNQNSGQPPTTAPAPVTTAQPAPRSEVTPPRATAATTPAVEPGDKAGQSMATSPTPESASPVRTILDRKPAATAAAPPQPTAAPTSTDAVDSGCVAGCYTPTSTQLTTPAARRAASAQQSGAKNTTAPAAQPGLQTGIECLAGCDGVDGKQLPRATSGAADVSAGQAPAATSQSGTNRVVIMRGNSRTKTYGVNQ